MALWNTKRFISMNLIILTFSIIIANGQLAITLMVMAIQLGISYEVWTIGIKPKYESQVPYFNKLRWYIFVAGTFYIIDGYFLMDLIKNTNHWMLNLLFNHHLICSSMLSYFCIIWFVIALNRHSTSIELLHYQYGQLAWNLSNCLIMLATAPIIRVTFEGLIWSVLPMSTVAANDIFAYGFGKLFGRHPLTELSPKKTWEGYIGSAFMTIPFGYALAAFLIEYEWMLCPMDTLSFGLYECLRNEIFEKQRYETFGGLEFYVEPFQIYNFWISLFISFVCPIGGFFASGYKRAFGKEDYGAIIPGHGGITDRMDAEVLMCGFVYLLHKTVMYSISVEDIRQIIVSELSDDQISVLIDVLKKLTSD